MKKYRIKNLDCPNCADSLENGLRKCEFIQNVRIDFSSGAMYLQTQDFDATLKEIKKLESEVEVSPWESEQKSESYQRELYFLLGLVGVFLLCVWGIEAEVGETFAYGVLGVVYLIAGLPVFRGAYRRIKAREFFDENFLMFFATISAICIGAYLEAVAVMLFFRAGEFFEGLAVRKSRSNISALMDLSPSFAWRKNAKAEVEKITPQQLEIGDIVVVKVGEKIPSDGVVVYGESELDQKAINGESIPFFAKVGDSVWGGSINILSVIEVRITKKYSDSSISQIIDLVQNASSKKAKTEKMITSFAKVYTPIVFIFALALAVVPPMLGFGSFEEWIYRALVVIMVSCPCALVLSVPLGYFGGIGGASKRGILIKGANYLEALANLDKVIFDKTGTLSKGEFGIVEIVPCGRFTKEEVLKIALCAEHLSTHPIAQSLQKAAKDYKIEHNPAQHSQFGGLGISAECCGNKVLAGNLALLDSFGVEHPKIELEDTAVHIALEGEYVGYIVVADELKDNAKEVIGKLKKMGIEVAMLSGDNARIAKKVGEKLGITKVYGDLLPQDKLEIFKQIKSPVSAFVGDGINDAPVLSNAEVGVSMGISGSDLSKESADVVLVNDDLDKLIQAISLARKTKTIIVQNIVFALGVKGVFIVLGIFGVAGMWEAVFGDVGVALLALLNSTRVLK